MKKNNHFTRSNITKLRNMTKVLILFCLLLFPHLIFAQVLVFPGINFDDGPEYVESTMKQNQTLVKDSETLAENFIFLTYKEGNTLYTFFFDNKKLDSISKNYSTTRSFKEEFSLLKEKLGYPSYYNESKGIAEWSSTTLKTTLTYDKKHKSFLLLEEGGEFNQYAWSLD